jgi:hypothetical protein
MDYFDRSWNTSSRNTAGDSTRTPTGMKVVGSPVGYFYRKRREYNFIQTHIKDMINFVDLIST